MRRIVGFGAAWLATAVVAMFVAWQGVGVVAEQVTDDRPAPLSASEVQAELAQPATTTSTSSSTTATTAAAAAAATAITRTYNLVGGSAALRFAPSGVTVLWANPHPGFEAEVSQHGIAARVELESDSHRSRVDGSWDDGPQDRVREEPRT